LVSPRQTIVFETAGTQTIGWARVVNGQSGATRAGWQQVEIVAPNSVLSIRAEYTVTCSNTQEQSEPFQGVRNQYYVAPRRYPLNSTDELPLFSPVSNVAASASATSALPAAAEPPAEPEGNSCGWYSAGPTNINGRITDIAIDPQNNQHVFVTSVGGIWRSVDGGRRWERVSDEFLTAVSASIAVNPRNSNEVLAGAGEPNYHRSTSQNGIWRSLAGGQRGSWTNVSGPELTGAIIYRLKFDPLAPNNVYAATSAGVYIGTRNAGDNFDWTLLGNFRSYAMDLAVDFSAVPRKIYATVLGSNGNAGGIWKYDGAAWNRRDNGIDTTFARTGALAISASNPNVLYAKFEWFNPNDEKDPRNGSLLGIYKTTSAAEQTSQPAWNNLPAASIVNDCSYHWYNSVIEVDPTDPDIVYAGGLDLYRSDNGGANWTKVSAGKDTSFRVDLHPDQHAVAFDPQNSKIVFVGGDGGIFKSGDTSAQLWHWNNISHGMVMTEFYKITSQQATATLLAGGSQDNGIEITFGNRTWYNPQGCDGVDVALDARNGDTLYANCNWGGWMYQFTNPIPQALGGGATIDWHAPASTIVGQPLITDSALSGSALAVGTTEIAPNRYITQLIKTTDNLNWMTMNTQFPDKLVTTFIAAAPSSFFQAYYVGLVPRKITDPLTPPEIWRTEDGGRTWVSASTGLRPELRPNNSAVDYLDARRAFLAAGGEAGGDVYLTRDGGASWQSLFGPGDAWLRAQAVTDVAIDPENANVIYIATSRGVFKGIINNNPVVSATWTRFDNGLPHDLDVNALWVNRKSGILTIGTMGHGVYERNISSAASCSDVMLSVRDNVFDNGTIPSPNNVPDPESPILDLSRPCSDRPDEPCFYRPDDTQAGLLQWWRSPDIRVDVPATNDAVNNLSAVDHVEFESCPIGARSCPPGTLKDTQPKPGQSARVHVQVSNRGTRAGGSVRVIALWADGRDAQFPLLPENFWTTTFPATGNCGAIAADSSWLPVDPANPCRTISEVTPELPEVVTFPWKVPGNVSTSSLLVIVESADDPLNPQIRQTNERRIFQLVPLNRQITVRNVQTLDTGVEIAEAIRLVNRAATDKQLNISVSDSAQAEDQPTLLLPDLTTIQSRGSTRLNQKLTPAAEKAAKKIHFHTNAGYSIVGNNFEVPQLEMEAGETKSLGIALKAQPQRLNAPPRRISIVVRDNGQVVGGITYIIRQ